jgi:hypothetical protein
VKKRGKEDFEKTIFLRVVYWPENNFRIWQHPIPPLVAARQLLLYLAGGGGPQIKFITPKMTLKTLFLKKYVKFKKIPDAFFVEIQVQKHGTLLNKNLSLVSLKLSHFHLTA